MTKPTDSPMNFVTSIDVSASPDGAGPAPVNFNVNEEVARLLRDLTGMTRELVLLAREQTELARRAEDRHVKQHEAQREEFVHWLNEHEGLKGRSQVAHETIRVLLGRSLDDFVTYIDNNQDGLLESDYVRSELVDRYGSLLNHVSAMFGLLKRLASADETGPDHAG